MLCCVVLQVRHLIEDFWKNTHLATGYQLLYTPHIAKVGACLPDCLRAGLLACMHTPPTNWQLPLLGKHPPTRFCPHTYVHTCPAPTCLPSCQVDLWKTSGHFDFYRDSMFNQMDVDAEEYQVGG